MQIVFARASKLDIKQNTFFTLRVIRSTNKGIIDDKSSICLLLLDLTLRAKSILMSQTLDACEIASYSGLSFHDVRQKMLSACFRKRLMVLKVALVYVEVRMLCHYVT